MNIVIGQNYFCCRIGTALHQLVRCTNVRMGCSSDVSFASRSLRLPRGYCASWVPIGLLFRGRDSAGWSDVDSSGLGSAAGSFFRLRLTTSPTRPAITSSVPAIMSQCGISSCPIADVIQPISLGRRKGPVAHSHGRECLMLRRSQLAGRKMQRCDCV
jgi:hypothetical protein